MPARFSYIDARGNEVEIGGTAQLMQRIRLGAIDGATQLYDAAGDRWAPAAEHPIYKELAAAVEEDASKAGSSREEPASPTEPEEPEPEEPEPEEPELDEPELEEPEPEEPEDDGGFEEMDFGLTLSGREEPAGIQETPEDEAPEEEEDGVSSDPFELEMGPMGTEESAGEEPADEDDEGEEDDASFDFGSAPLELEETEEEEEEEEEEPEEASESAGGGGMELESPLDHLGVDEDEDSAGSGGFEEGSLVAGAADEDWASPDEDWEDEAEEPEPEPARDPSGGRAETGPGGEEGSEASREARPRPARPAPRESSSSGSFLTLLLLVAILAGGGWAGYTYFLGGSERSAEPAGPGPHPRATRTVPSELRERMAPAALQAMSQVSVWIQEQADVQGMAERPPREWLDGIYLAHASRYPEVEAYFSGVQSLVNLVRSQGSQRLLDAYEAALAEADLSEDQRARIRGWMEEDLEWSRFQRDSVYLILDEVTGAALDLHALLVDREDDIGYELMEAQPSTDALKSEIDGQVDRLTGSLDDLNALGQVTTVRFVEILQNNLRETVVPDLGPAAARP